MSGYRQTDEAPFEHDERERGRLISAAVDDHGFRTTLVHSSFSVSNSSYIAGASSSPTRCEMISGGLITRDAPNRKQLLIAN